MTDAIPVTGRAQDAVRPFRVYRVRYGARRPASADHRDASGREGDRRRSSQGVQLATMQALARYWATEYDWRKAEARLNALPQFVTDDRRARHPFHPRPLEREERAAADRHPRLAGLGARADQVDRSVDRSRGRTAARRRTRSTSSFRRCRGTASRASRRALAGARANGARVGGADEAARLRPLCGAGGRLGRVVSSTWGCRRRRGCSPFTPTCRRTVPADVQKALDTGQPAPANLHPTRSARTTSSSTRSSTWTTRG